MTPAQVAIAKMMADLGIQLARLLGVDPPIDRVREAANRYAAELLPVTVVALDTAVQRAAAEATARIDSLGEDVRCPNDGTVLRIRIDGNGRWESCDRCGYMRAVP